MKYLIVIMILIPQVFFSNEIVLKYYPQNDYPGIDESVDCPDSLNCYILTQSGEFHQLFKSTNQGNTWEMIYQSESMWDQIKQGVTVLMNVEDGCSPHPDYYFMSFYDEGFLKKSSDGGKTFIRIDLKEQYRIASIEMLDTNIGVAYSYSGNIYLTFDGWKTWEIKNTPIINDSTWISGFWEPKFKDDSTIIGLSLLINPLDTVDWGYGFKDFYSYGEVLFSWNYLTDHWSYVLFPKIYYGVNDTLHPDTCEAIGMIDFINDTIGFVCGGKGYGIGQAKYEIIYKTKDAGKTWKKVFENFNQGISNWGLYDISFKNELNGVAVGPISLVLVTGDGGETWEYLPRNDTLVWRQALTAIVTWAGDYPIIGTYSAGFYRIEGANGEPPVFKKATKPPVIQADDYDFGKIDIKYTSRIKQKIKISNLSSDSDLLINGFSNFNETSFQNEFVWLDTLTNITLKPSEYFELPVSFKPNESRDYKDSIIVHSNAVGQDSIIVLEGEGIDDTTSVDDSKIYVRKIIISPNPASVYIEISVGAHCNVPVQEIKIYNIFGQCVMQSSLPSPFGVGQGVRLDVSHLPTGIYFIRARNHVGKFVVLR